MKKIKQICIVILMLFTFNSYGQSSIILKNQIFQYKNFSDTSIIFSRLIAPLNYYGWLNNGILKDEYLLQIECGKPVIEKLKTFFCEQEMIHQWQKYLNKDSALLDTPKKQFIETRKKNIKIFFVGNIMIDSAHYDPFQSYLFVVKEDAVFFHPDSFESVFLNRKLVLLNVNSNRVTSMVIVGYYNSNAWDSKHYLSYYDSKRHFYNFRGEYFCQDVFYAKKRDARRAQKNNTDLGVIFTFDRDGYVKIIEEHTKYWDDYE